MARKISVGINWQGSLDYKALIERVQIADAVGVHSAWVPEAWGRDAFTILAVLADRTKKIQLGTAIVNTYSRTPAALAQHFATLDELSGGRMIIGSGAVAKLAHNLIVYVNMMAASEGMRLAEKAGLDLKAMQEVVHAGAAQSRIADNWLQQRRLKDTYTTGPQGLLQLIHKDLRLALELGHDVGVGLPGAALAQQLIDRVLEIDK